MAHGIIPRLGKFMFIQNKYYQWYMALVAKDDLFGYREEHHKIPRSLGGNGSKSNLVLLSARKHFLAHWLLTKCTEGEHQRAMFWAFACMSRNPSGERNLSSWQFARARESYSDAAKGRPSNMKGRTHNQESRKKMSISRKGGKHSEEHKANISKGLEGKIFGWPKGRPKIMTIEEKADFVELMKKNPRINYSPSIETRAKLAAASMGNKSKTGVVDSVETLRKKQLAQLERPTWAKSGLKGVIKIGDGRWVSRIKRKHIGVFKCPAAAHFAYLVAADKVRSIDSLDR
jgi:hypothetical protein